VVRYLKKILVYGSRDFGQVIKALVKNCGYEFSGFIDDFNTGDEIVGKFLEVCDTFSSENYEIVIAIGYNNLKERWKIYRKVSGAGYRIPHLIHPKAYVSESCKVGEGVIIMTGAIVDINVKLAELVVLWPGVVVNHDSEINANTFLSPNSTICGFVTIGENCFLGAGAVVVDHMRVPEDSFIKAGRLFKG